MVTYGIMLVPRSNSSTASGAFLFPRTCPTLYFWRKSAGRYVPTHRSPLRAAFRSRQPKVSVMAGVFSFLRQEGIK